MGKADDEILGLLRRFGYQRDGELAELSELDISVVRNALRELKSAGFVEPLDDDGLWGTV